MPSMAWLPVAEIPLPKQITHLPKRRRQTTRNPYLNDKIVVSAVSPACETSRSWVTS